MISSPMMNRDLRILTKTRGSNAQWFRVCSAPAENPPFSSSTHTWQCTTKCNSSSRWFSALFWHLWATAFTWHIFRYISRSNNNEHGMLEITWTKENLILCCGKWVSPSLRKWSWRCLKHLNTDLPYNPDMTDGGVGGVLRIKTAQRSPYSSIDLSSPSQ